MAGGKLSPRQKMINMMYLVLTALLALNVSAEILQAFDSLRASLRTSATGYAERNEKLVGDIESVIDDELKSGITTNQHYKKTVTDVSVKTREMITHINGLVKELEEIGGMDPLTKELLHKDETNANYTFWLGDNDVANDGRGNGKAKELKDKLNAYIAWANKEFAEIDPEKRVNFFSKLALEPSEDKSITDSEAKGHAWEYHTFHGKPVIADLAMVEKFKMDVREVETQLLQAVSKNLNVDVYPVDTLYAMEAPMSDVVASGMPFKTRIFVTMGSKSAKPEFAGPGVEVEPGGSSAWLNMNANGSLIPDGKSEAIQRYSARIKVPKRDGTFAELPLEGEFTVRRPEVVVRSKVVQNLYRACANTVTVDVPALGEYYRPDFSRSTGGKAVVSGSNVKEVTLVPTERSFTLAVYSNTNGQNIKIEDINYNVLPTPKPKFAIMQGSAEYDGRSKIRKGTTVKLKIIPDAEFASMLRLDARYRATEVKVMVQDGMTTAKTIETIRGDFQAGVDYNLSGAAIKALPAGSRVFFEISEISRINFQGNSIPEKGITLQDRFRTVIVQ
jgi:gliding motility-associated protein GldM